MHDSQAKKIQIAIVSNEPTPYRLHVLDRLSRELDGIEIHNIFTHTLADPSMPWQMQIGKHLNPVFFPEHHLSFGKTFSMRSVHLFRDIRDFLTRQDVKFVGLLGYNDLTRMMLIRWGHQTDVPIALMGDSNIFADNAQSLMARLIKRTFMRWMLRRLKALMPMGTCGRAFFRRYMDHSLPEFICPYEPDYTVLSRPDETKLNAFRAKYNLQPERRRLLFCGRLVDIKRVDVLIAAFAQIAVDRPDWDVVIAGDGPLRQELRDAVPAPFRDRVKWLGFLQFQETAMAYHSCDALVLPSEMEPWALVVCEAVACDLPVVTTSVVGAAVELVRHRVNGLVVPLRSVSAMAEALLEITEADNCRRMGEKCAEILQEWRRGADPVDGIRAALRHFGLLEASRTSAEMAQGPIKSG